MVSDSLSVFINRHIIYSNKFIHSSYFQSINHIHAIYSLYQWYNQIHTNLEYFHSFILFSLVYEFVSLNNLVGKINKKRDLIKTEPDPKFDKSLKDIFIRFQHNLRARMHASQLDNTQTKKRRIPTRPLRFSEAPLKA